MLRKRKRETLILSDMEQTKFKQYAAAFRSGAAALYVAFLDYIKLSSEEIADEIARRAREDNDKDIF